MANAIYTNARKLLLEAGVNWLTDTINAQLIDSAVYAINVNTHVSLADIPPAARVGAAVTLTGKLTDGGAADAEDTTFVDISGPTLEAVLLYKVGATEADSPLLVYLDNVTGLPITPNGGDIIVTWDNGVNKIFRP